MIFKKILDSFGIWLLVWCYATNIAARAFYSQSFLRNKSSHAGNFVISVNQEDKNNIYWYRLHHLWQTMSKKLTVFEQGKVQW